MKSLIYTLSVLLIVLAVGGLWWIVNETPISQGPYGEFQVDHQMETIARARRRMGWA